MSTRDVVYVAMFAAVTAALAVVPPLTLPMTGVPITAQSLGPMLAGAVLGWKRAAASQALFLALVAAGLPLLAGGRGGLGVLAGPSGGFLIGFVLAALVIGWSFERSWERLNLASALALVFLGGVVVVYAVGNAWVSVVTDLSYLRATIVSAAYLPGDLLKVVAAGGIAMTVRRSYPLMPATAHGVTSATP
jgi:biotin transport system substrate-specific component